MEFDLIERKYSQDFHCTDTMQKNLQNLNIHSSTRSRDTVSLNIYKDCLLNSISLDRLDVIYHNNNRKVLFKINKK